MGLFLKSQRIPKPSKTRLNAKQKFGVFEDVSFLDIKNRVQRHHLRSGEIIMEISLIQHRFFSVNDLLINFFRNVGIRTEETAFDNRNINFEKYQLEPEEAIQKIIYGLSSKPNFTLIDYPFSDKKSRYYAEQFIGLFQNPRLYNYNSKLYQKTLDMSDMWESGGFVITDDEKIGIFWANDLYDWIDPEFTPLFSSFIG